MSAYLVWARSRPSRPSYVPLCLTALWVACCLAQYLRSGWHLYLYNHVLWLGGVASIAVTALIPLVIAVIVEALTARILPRPLPRAALAAATGIGVIFLVQPQVAWWAADVVQRLAR